MSSERVSFSQKRKRVFCDEEVVDMLFSSDEECENLVDSFSSSSDESVINESDFDDESPLVTPTSSNTWSNSKVFTPHGFHFDSFTSGIQDFKVGTKSCFFISSIFVC
jgi:hypothetical protein